MRFFKRILASLLRILAGVPIVCLLVGGMLFLILGATLIGRCVGLSAAILGGVLFCSVGYWNREWFKRIRRRFYAVLLPLAAMLYLVAMILAPSGGTADARVRNCFLGGQRHFPRYSPWNVIPEVDQLKVGLSLAAVGHSGDRFRRGPAHPVARASPLRRNGQGRRFPCSSAP